MSVWTELSHDPRVAEHARLRAGDADRDVVQALLTHAYAEGRLTPVEHDQRMEALWQASTLGDLRALLLDLVPERDPVAPPAATYERAWGRLWLTFLVSSIACVLVWRFAAPGLFWPLWVIVYTGLPLVRHR